MPHFIIEYAEQPGSAQARSATRAAHVAFLEGMGQRLVLAGPLVGDGPDAASIGGLIVVEAKDKADAEKIAAAEPYVGAGVFKLTRIALYRVNIVNKPAGLGH